MRRPSAAPVSSSAVSTSFSSPRAGRQPSRASAVAAATSAATWPFMSWAPRPRTSPSTTSPAQGSKLHSVGVGGDGVDVAEQAEGLARRLARQPGDQVRAPGLGGEQLALEAGVAEARGEQLLGRALVAGRVDGVEADQLAEQLDRLGSELGPAAAVSSPMRSGYSAMGY